VEERHDHSGVVRVGGGASTEQSEPGSFPLGAYAALGYEHRNLFGQSWLWTSRAELGRSLTRVSSDFNNPRFFDSLFRLRLTGSYLRQNTVRLGDLRSGTGTVGLERELTSGLDLSFHYRLSSTVRTEYLLRGGGPDGEQETVAIGTVVGAFGLVLEWQRLDSPLVPTRGFKLQAGIEWANPRLSARYGEDTFLKATVRTLNVVPVSRRVSVRYSLRYDQGFPLGGASLLPKVERFFAGGDTTLRGFELDRARTDDVQAESVPGLTIAQHRPLGGSLRILQNLDLQIEILGAWFGGLFIDSGVVADAFDGLSPQSFRHGAGIAPLVVKLPIGDLSIAWAWPLDPKSGDSASGRLHFNVGLMY
jgi:outer membrane protein assembly factor BamA